jgi:DNA repair exonuclease SbcCD nuclease subunit
MDELRVLHAADLHIDSPMRGLIEYEGAPVDRIRGATRTALTALVGEAIARQVHLVVIAGDLFDGDWRDYNTGLFVVSQLAALNDAGIPVVLVYGNHDAESQLTKRLRLPPNTKALAFAAPETYFLPQLGVALHGQSYATRAITADLSLNYPRADPGLINIGVLHTCFDGCLGHDPYAPCSLADLRSKGYDYWALGHVHERTVVCTDPLTVFPGNLQGRHARETGPKGATLVTFIDHQPRIEPLTFDIVRWARCVVDLSAMRTFDACLERCRESLLDVCSTGSPAYAIRVQLNGATSMNRFLRSTPEQLVNEVRALSLTLGGAEVWIEKVVVDTTSPAGQRALQGAGAIEEINRVYDELKGNVSALLEGEKPSIPALAALRSQIRSVGEPDLYTALDEATLANALRDATELLASLLSEEDDELAD